MVYLVFNTTYTDIFSLDISLLAIFKTAGLIVSVLLLIQSIDSNNPLIKKLCGGDNNKNCNAILSSEAAKIGKHLSWSEVGFFYFSCTWLAVLFNRGNLGLMQALAILNILSLPYTIYSVYYQWRIARQWCILCCTVQGLLWLEFSAFIIYLLQPLQLPALATWGNLFICMVAPIAAWIIIKPYLLQINQIQPLKQQLRLFKYNTELFQKMLNSEVRYALPAAEDSLIIGNREAEHVITMVSNPYCQPCSKAHKALNDWLVNRKDIKLQLVFPTPDDEKDIKARVASHFMTLQTQCNDTSLKKALDDWYNQKQKNYELWTKQYPANHKTTNAPALQKQREWCKMVEITGTPTIFINGRRLPEPYQPEDIKYFI